MIYSKSWNFEFNLWKLYFHVQLQANIWHSTQVKIKGSHWESTCLIKLSGLHNMTHACKTPMGARQVPFPGMTINAGDWKTMDHVLYQQGAAVVQLQPVVEPQRSFGHSFSDFFRNSQKFRWLYEICWFYNISNILKLIKSLWDNSLPISYRPHSTWISHACKLCIMFILFFFFQSLSTYFFFSKLILFQDKL